MSERLRVNLKSCLNFHNTQSFVDTAKAKDICRRVGKLKFANNTSSIDYVLPLCKHLKIVRLHGCNPSLSSLMNIPGEFSNFS